LIYKVDSDHDLLWQYVEEIVTYFKCKFQFSRTWTRRKIGKGVKSLTYRKLRKKFPSDRKRVRKSEAKNLPCRRLFCCSYQCFERSGKRSVELDVIMNQLLVSGKTHQLIAVSAKLD